MKPRKYTKDGFVKWLKRHGCEILPVSNEYEAVRWKGKQVGVVYASRKTSGGYADTALLCYLKGKSWHGGPITTGRLNNYKRQKAQILERDGSDCFYCARPMGDDITLEHLIELNQGGKNTLGNEVLAHEKCNKAVNGMTVVEKFNYAMIQRNSNIKNKDMGIKGFGINKSKEEKESINFLIGRSRVMDKLGFDKIKITKSTISVHDDYLKKSFEGHMGGFWGALAIFDEHICLVLSMKKDDSLIKIPGVAKGSARRYLNVPTSGKDMAAQFAGIYELEKYKQVEHYFLFKILKVKNEER